VPPAPRPRSRLAYCELCNLQQRHVRDMKNGPFKSLRSYASDQSDHQAMVILILPRKIASGNLPNLHDFRQIGTMVQSDAGEGLECESRSAPRISGELAFPESISMNCNPAKTSTQSLSHSRSDTKYLSSSFTRSPSFLHHF
jgi:hypothetical protein